MVVPDMVVPDMGSPDMGSPDMVSPDMVPPNSRFSFFVHKHIFKVRTLKEWLRNTLLAAKIHFRILNISHKWPYDTNIGCV